jgi:subtilase family serine protease
VCSNLLQEKAITVKKLFLSCASYLFLPLAFSVYLLGQIPVTVQAAGQADLVLTVSTKTTVIAPGKTLSASSTVKNQGGAAAGSFLIAYHLSTNTTYGDGDDVVIAATRKVNSLKAGVDSTAASTLTIPVSTPVGTYHLCAMADSGSAVAESDETNNTFCTTGTIQVTEPDLVLTALTPTIVKINLATVSVTNTVKNLGAVPAGGFEIAFNLSPTAGYDDPGAVPIPVVRKIGSLAAGASSTATTKLNIPLTTPAGSYYICAKADASGAVTELDENNTRCSPGPITVTAPDLVMTAVSTTAVVIFPGKTLSVSSTAKNQGAFPAGSFLIAFHLSANGIFGDGDDVVIAATRKINSLAVGGSSTASTTLTIPFDIPPGPYYICAMADSAGALSEADETNNTRCSVKQTPTAGFWGNMTWGFGIW